MYNTSLAEAASPGSHVVTIHATDADSSSTYGVTYSIISGADGVFTIDPSSGRITVEGALDREMKDGYLLTVEASDGELTSTSSVAIGILDQNDNHPIFSQAVYSFSVREDELVSSLIDKVEADDLDEGSNGAVRYHVIKEGAPGESIFTLSQQTGELLLAQTLDFEQVS